MFLQEQAYCFLNPNKIVKQRQVYQSKTNHLSTSWLIGKLPAVVRAVLG